MYEGPITEVFHSLTAKGAVKTQKSRPKRASIFCKESSNVVRIRKQINPDATCDEDEVIVEDEFTEHRFEVFVDGESITGERKLKYWAYHGYGRGPGKRNFIERILSGDVGGNFSKADLSQCVNEDRVNWFAGTFHLSTARA